MFYFIFYFFIILVLTFQMSLGSFGYSRRQQHNWPREFKDCGGKFQSPIELSPSKSIILPLPSLELLGYHNYLPRLTIKNNGHSVALNVDNNNLKLNRKLPYIFGATLEDNEGYEFSGLHFHWGLKNYRGSEHVVNGIRYPMEMHIIHKNKLYLDIKEAQEHKNGLVVLGIFFQLQDEDNNNLNPILKNFQSLKWIDSDLKMNLSITLKSLLPSDIDTYYTYRGSLTTPPCSEAVTWIIFTNPIPISFRQLNKFRFLSNGEDSLGDNFRKLQDLGKRKLYLRKLNDDFAKKYDSGNFNISDLEWIYE
ncbi:carbonic anhydrase 9-like isoform X1 [Microplitis mediator]|uniref:carbonic anhydrase 9-like isoform X1 n=2 Tax=Microplitis mediator TaxID=375433 RepID=UPI0025572B5C|nr:carbonic anhydrase 9-like isoform X1 [Microplitis mediator]